ncbi:MAG: ATP-binding protein [Holophagales bacterium]|nr:ATP-binding protein [Holophagales bacterium]
MGKTHLAVAFGIRAIETGFAVVFFRLEEPLATLKRDADLPPVRLRRRRDVGRGLGPLARPQGVSTVCGLLTRAGR